MTKILFNVAFAIGVLAIIWVGRIFLGDDSLGFWVTLLIGAVYVLGVWELLRYRRATVSLDTSLSELSAPPADFKQWVSTLEPRFQDIVRLRMDGARNPLPAPVLTPYLVGLLVMLGLLGTFIGMVDTLKGAVVALQGSSELEAIRAGLAAPIEGLGLAFGTSIAGVAASAMLGLLSTLSRRERMHVSQLLDNKLANELHSFTANHQQQSAFLAMQQQAQALPELVQKMGDLANNLEAMGERVNQGLLANQTQFQDTVIQQYQALNESVDSTLKTSLLESSQLLSSSIQPMAQETLERLNESALSAQQQMAKLNQEQLGVINESVQSNNELVREALDAGINQQRQSTDALLASVNDAVNNTVSELKTNSAGLLESHGVANEQFLQAQHGQAEEFVGRIRDELSRLREEESERANTAIERLSDLQATVSNHLLALGQGLEEPMQRLIETASQTPKAAAEVIEKLRGEISKNLERDNDLLSERTRLMTQLESVSESLEQSSNSQRDAIDSLVKSSADTLSKVGEQFGTSLQQESSKLTGAVEYFASSSAEMASLGDAFNAAVTLFSESNSQLIESFTRIESTLEQSNSRSDEQLAYYVAQARDIIDHSLLAHKEVIDTLRAQQRVQAVAKEVS